VAPVRFGLQLWPQNTTWPEYRECSLAAEAAQWESIWTWDHLLAIQGPWEQPIYEGWGLLHGVAAITSRVRLGLMVGANTFRNPGVTTKLATTLDHVSNGRAVLGIGGAWFEREHEAFGIDFGASVGERLDWLGEAVPLMRRLLDGERVSHAGRFRRTSRSSSAAAARRRRSGSSRATPTRGTRTGPSRPCGGTSTSWPATARTPAGTSRRSRRRSASR
jgi:alkanesulfonate monooxygenase SsuD/methylene tetrahydromethanopterin reductase-like flavin-dependent oxidoreductase (luciferase family)